MTTPIRNLLTLLALVVSYSILSPAFADSLVNKLDNNQRAQFYQYLTTQGCTCGCNLTLANCLRTHKSCTHSPRVARSKLMSLLAQSPGNRPPFNRPRQAAQTGNLNPAFFGVWLRRTQRSNRYIAVRNTIKIAFYRNGLVEYGNKAGIGGGDGSTSIRGRGNYSVLRGRWSIQGNMITMVWENGQRERWKYSIFPYNGNRVLSLSGTFYKFYRRL